MNKIKIGLVGCGKVSHLHAAAVRSLPNAELVAACSSDAGRAAKFAAQYGIQPFHDLRQMIEKAGVQAVSICTEHPRHADPAVTAAQAGVHVIVEKPLASSLADCDRMVAAARAGGVKLGTICQRRFYAPCIRIREAIDAGKIGRPALGVVTMYGWRDEAYYKSDPWRGTWRGEGGGVLVNQAPHQLDLLNWFIGPIAEVSAYWGNLNHPYIEVEDTALAIVRFTSGALGQILVSNAQNPALYGKVHVFGANGAGIGTQTEGGAMFIAGRTKITEPPVNDLWTVPGEESHLEKWKKEDSAFFQTIDPTVYYIARQLEDFVEAIRHNRPPGITGDDGRRTVELFTAIYRSQRDGKAVKFPLPADDGLGDYDGRLGKRG